MRRYARPRVPTKTTHGRADGPPQQMPSQARWGRRRSAPRGKPSYRRRPLSAAPRVCAPYLGSRVEEQTQSLGASVRGFAPATAREWPHGEDGLLGAHEVRTGIRPPSGSSQNPARGAHNPGVRTSGSAPPNLGHNGCLSAVRDRLPALQPGSRVCVLYSQCPLASRAVARRPAAIEGTRESGVDSSLRSGAAIHGLRYSLARRHWHRSSWGAAVLPVVPRHAKTCGTPI